jgi:DUF4097 and DUF4098 domain-containing protein YvlB
MKAPLLMALHVAIPIAVMTAGAQFAAAEEVTKSTPADARGEVEIVNVAGSVQVNGWNRAEVQVNADLGSSVERLEFRRDGQRTYVKVILPKGRGSSRSSDLVVNIPRDSSLAVNTVSAEQRIEGVHGTQRLQAVSGDIETTFGPGDLEVKTVSGNILARGRDGKGSVRATTINGDLQLADTGPELDLNTVTGDMNVRLERLDRGRIKTTNGDLQLTTKLGDEARLDVEAVNGDLTFDLRGDLSAEFDIETFNGDIDNCFGPVPRRSREHGPGKELHFSEGKGRAQVRIKTLNGGVNVCKR